MWSLARLKVSIHKYKSYQTVLRILCIVNTNAFTDPHRTPNKYAYLEPPISKYVQEKLAETKT